MSFSSKPGSVITLFGFLTRLPEDRLHEVVDEFKKTHPRWNKIPMSEWKPVVNIEQDGRILIHRDPLDSVCCYLQIKPLVLVQQIKSHL